MRNFDISRNLLDYVFSFNPATSYKCSKIHDRNVYFFPDVEKYINDRLMLLRKITYEDIMDVLGMEPDEEYIHNLNCYFYNGKKLILKVFSVHPSRFDPNFISYDIGFVEE